MRKPACISHPRVMTSPHVIYSPLEKAASVINRHTICLDRNYSTAPSQLETECLPAACWTYVARLSSQEQPTCRVEVPDLEFDSYSHMNNHCEPEGWGNM